jgi:hypothetical protein
MLIEAGFDVAFECPAATPMILQLSIHPSRDADLLTPDRIASDPPLPMRSYLDLFGNRVTRVEVPAGLVTFSDRFVIQDSGEPDETPPDVRTTPIADLPDDALLFLVSSRDRDSGQLADFARSQFGKLSGGARCVQAICDFARAKMRTSRSSTLQQQTAAPAVAAKDFSAILCNRIEQATKVRPTWLPGSSSNGDDIANHHIRGFRDCLRATLWGALASRGSSLSWARGS